MRAGATIECLDLHGCPFAESGFVFRELRAAANPSPAALRLSIDGAPPKLRIIKCRGGMPPARAFDLHG